MNLTWNLSIYHTRESLITFYKLSVYLFNRSIYLSLYVCFSTCLNLDLIAANVDWGTW